MLPPNYLGPFSNLPDLCLTADGHFDGANIIRNCEELTRAVQALKSPAKARKEALSQSMKFHEFNFDLARELEWIAEKQSILNSTGDIQTLQQVCNTFL
jgi:spectrin beta